MSLAPFNPGPRFEDNSYHVRCASCILPSRSACEDMETSGTSPLRYTNICTSLLKLRYDKLITTRPQPVKFAEIHRINPGWNLRLLHKHMCAKPSLVPVCVDVLDLSMRNMLYAV